jgi:hypothetical protein
MVTRRVPPTLTQEGFGAKTMAGFGPLSGDGFRLCPSGFVEPPAAAAAGLFFGLSERPLGLGCPPFLPRLPPRLGELPLPPREALLARLLPLEEERLGERDLLPDLLRS